MTDNIEQTVAQQTPTPNTSTSTAIEGQSNGATFTQAQLNEMIGKTRKDARDTAIADVLKELGLTSKDELKSTIEDARKRKEADMTESQKAQAERDKALEDKKALEQRIAQLEETRKSDLVESAIRQEASKQKANNPKTVLSYILVNHREAMRAAINDDGTIDDKKITTLFETVKKEDSSLFTAIIPGAGSQSNAGQRHVLTEAEAMKRFSANNQRTIRGR